MPERIWAGNNGRYSTLRLLKKPILDIPADVEYLRADLLTRNGKPITELPDVQRVVKQNVVLEAENKQLREALRKTGLLWAKIFRQYKGGQHEICVKAHDIIKQTLKKELDS